MMKALLVGAAFTETLSALKKSGKRYIDRSYDINKLLVELGFNIDAQNNYPSLYIKTLLILNYRDNFQEFISLLNEQEVFESFIRADKEDDREIFNRILNSNLHTNPKYIKLKKYNEIPEKIVSGFFQTFDECRKETLTPNDVSFQYENFSQHAKTQDELAQLGTQLTNFLNVIQKPSSDKEIQLSNKLNQLYKDRLEQVFKSIKEGNIESEHNSLFKLKEEIWEVVDNDDELKNSLLKKIAYCYLEKREFVISSQYYEEALKYKNDSGTLSTLALIYHLTSDEINFEKIILKLEENNPEKAEITKIRFGKSSEHPDSYYKQVLNDEIKDEETLLALIHYYSEAKKFEIAFLIGNILIQLFSKNEYKDFISNFGINILQFKGIHAGLNYLESKYREIFNQGLTYITECSDFYKGKEIEKYKSDAFANRAIYETWNENYEIAIEFVEYAIQLDSSNYSYLKILATVYTKQRLFKKALETFSKIPSDEKGFEDLALLKSVCHFVIDEEEKAVAILEESIHAIEDFDIKQRTIEQLLNYYFLFGEIGKARNVYLKNKDFLLDDYKLLVNAKFLRQDGKNDEAEKGLNELKDKLIKAKEFSPLLIDLGNELEKNKNKDSLIELYEAYVNYSEETFFLGRLYDIYSQTGRMDKALEICLAQRNKGIHKFFTRNEIAIYQSFSNHDKVIELGELYIQEYPEDIEIRLHLIHSLIKKDKKQDARHYLNYPIKIKELNEVNAGNLLDHYIKLNLPEDAFETAYALLAYNDNAHFNDLYMKVNIFHDSYLSNLDTNRVGYNTSVTITENDETKVLTFVSTQSDKQITNYYNEVKTDNPKYYKLFEAKVGDKKNISINQVQYNFEILEIKHKYIFAFHKALKKCGTSYKSESVFKMLDASSLASGQLPDFIKTTLQESEKTSQIFDDFLKLYETGKIPLMSIALFTKRQFIELWNFCKYSDTHFIRSCSGILDELHKLNTILEKANEKKLLFDISSLLLVYSIDAVDSIKEQFDVYIIQDILDYLEGYLEINKIGAENESATVTKVKGENIFVKSTAEQKQEELSKIRAFVNWIKANFKIQPPDLLININRQELDKYSEVLGAIAAKSLLISSNSNITLLCEDLALKNISISEFKKPAMWTQAILYHLSQNGLLKMLDYNSFSRKILEQNLFYTHTNSDILLESFSKSNYQINSQNLRILKILRGNQSDNSAFIVGFGFLKKIWETKENIETSLKQRITFELLLSLYINRSSATASAQIKVILNKLTWDKVTFNEIVNQLEKLENYIRVIR